MFLKIFITAYLTVNIHSFQQNSAHFRIRPPGGWIPIPLPTPAPPPPPPPPPANECPSLPNGCITGGCQTQDSILICNSGTAITLGKCYWPHPAPNSVCIQVAGTPQCACGNTCPARRGCIDTANCDDTTNTCPAANSALCYWADPDPGCAQNVATPVSPDLCHCLA